MKKVLIYGFFSLIGLSKLKAQHGVTGHPDWLIKPGYDQCFIIVHRANLAHLVQGYPGIMELNVAKPTLGNKLWQIENNLPTLGITFQYIDFKNPRELGQAFVLAPYVEIPLNKKEKTSRLYLRLCWGLSWLNRPFEIQTNHKNVAIGGHLNAYAQFKWFWQIPVGKNLSFEPGFTFAHSSNGKMQNPNLGLNMMGVTAALNFRIPGKKQILVNSVDSSTKVKSRYEVMAFTAFGVNEREIEGKQLGTFVVSAALQCNIRNTHKFSLGLDFFHDKNYQTDYYNEFGTQPLGIEQWRISARFGYSYNVGRLSFPY